MISQAPRAGLMRQEKSHVLEMKWDIQGQKECGRISEVLGGEV